MRMIGGLTRYTRGRQGCFFADTGHGAFSRTRTRPGQTIASSTDTATSHTAVTADFAAAGVTESVRTVVIIVVVVAAAVAVADMIAFEGLGATCLLLLLLRGLLL